jgi:hypothetical protein
MRMLPGLHPWQRMFDFSFVLLSYVVFETLVLLSATYVKLLNLYYSVYPSPSETIRGSNFYGS